MLRLPSPDLLSVDRANFDACADKIPTFLSNGWPYDGNTPILLSNLRAFKNASPKLTKTCQNQLSKGPS